MTPLAYKYNLYHFYLISYFIQVRVTSLNLDVTMEIALHLGTDATTTQHRSARTEVTRSVATHALFSAGSVTAVSSACPIQMCVTGSRIVTTGVTKRDAPGDVYLQNGSVMTRNALTNRSGVTGNKIARMVAMN